MLFLAPREKVTQGIEEEQAELETVETFENEAKARREKEDEGKDDDTQAKDLEKRVEKKNADSMAWVKSKLAHGKDALESFFASDGKTNKAASQK